MNQKNENRDNKDEQQGGSQTSGQGGSQSQSSLENDMEDSE